ncbi:hypothetical protein ESCO_005591 [Escovopsis weberi]|uniref:Uncharacterized protein n=1 Tax=Escovopsis weberi TaxID=150374 RepID=A0A0N0RTK0_ESCWE|nr:hypothetical protein ESCO_005591 [Escovopsis weberi]
MRELNPSYKQAEPLSTMFKILVFPTKYTYAGRAMTIPFYNPYDLLGLFLGLLGPAEQGANQYNYFLPLSAVYARWCSRLAGKGKGGPQPAGVGPWPFMFQCSWRPLSNADPRRIFFLGASLGGDDFSKEGRGDAWREALQRRRFDVAFRSAEHVLFLQDEFNNITDVVAGAKNNPGNCAETYTFTHTVQSVKTDNRALHGLALRRDLLIKKKFPTTYDESHYRGQLSGPCPTCAHALGRAGGVEANFKNGASG